MATCHDTLLSRHHSPTYRFVFRAVCSYFQIDFDHPLRRGEISQPNHHLCPQKWSVTITTNHHSGITTKSRAYSHLNAGAVPWTRVNCRGHPRSGPEFNKTSVAMAKAGKVVMFGLRTEKYAI
jgi:hypothetical protein